VIVYDRRGRGESGDRVPYSVEREVEDIDALLGEVGGSAPVWGNSSGAVLALEAAQRLKGIERVALYEAPLGAGSSTSSWQRITDAVAAGRRGEAVRIFLAMVGTPAFVIAVMRLLPFWSRLEALAHTLPYDGALVRDLQSGQPPPAGRWSTVTVPTLVMDGARSPAWLRHANRDLALALPNAQYRSLERQSHVLKPKVHAPRLAEFFSP
jgi:pimeloyl-ACP methyl ester carboxylesterase